jgi:hypothetical protein
MWMLSFTGTTLINFIYIILTVFSSSEKFNNPAANNHQSINLFLLIIWNDNLEIGIESFI